jgi:tetratricopeptide (TPR) repeat protein/transcriptional regulator with XRE-family HTH domain
VAEAPVTFAGLLRRLRANVQLTQAELASAASLSVRAIGDLERGVATTPQKDTVRLLADALHLIGPERAAFESVARGRPLTSGPEATAMRSLPRDVASFSGRQLELDQLVAAALGERGVVGIHAIGGMAGVGKTAFAVHAAHQLTDAFPDGQIFFSLHGHTPGRQPVEPADALASLLLTIGVRPAQIPPSYEARMSLWRDQVAGKRFLLLLDDAVDSEQVAPLLPGAGGGLVLVTSRRHLSALDDATPISLDVLLPVEASELLVRLAGRAGLRPDDPAVAQLTGLCGYLPLAIGMMARQLRHHAAWSVAGRAADLAAARDRLELLATENLSVAAAFDLSYASLSPDQQRLFRRLGLHPGPDIEAHAAAALDGTDLSAARRGLEALYDHYLLTEPTQGRYQQHDLVREHARALAVRDDLRNDRELALERLLDYYQHAAGGADTLIARQTRPAPVRTGNLAPAAAPELVDPEQALAWARAERANLLSCLDYATDNAQHTRVVELTAGLAALLRHDGPWPEAIARHTAAVEAAQSVGDGLAEANALADLGDIRWLTGDYPAAARAREQALDIYHDVGDRQGQANVLQRLGTERRRAAGYPAAARFLEQALDIYLDLGDRRGQASSLVEIGAVRSDIAAGLLALEQALSIYRDLGDRRGQANTLSFIGARRSEAGDHPAAARAQEQALEICRDLGDRLGQAHTLNGLGVVRRSMGDYRVATEVLTEALGIYRDLGARHGQAGALSSLGIVHRLTGDLAAATRDLEDALSIFRDLGTPHGQAATLHDLGIVQRLMANYEVAARAQEQALDIFRDIGHRGSQGQTLNEQGTLYRIKGELALAEGCHRQALELARAIGSSGDEARALSGLGRCALAAGDAAQARKLLQQALQSFQGTGAAEAKDLEAELAAISESGP